MRRQQIQRRADDEERSVARRSFGVCAPTRLPAARVRSGERARALKLRPARQHKVQGSDGGGRQLEHLDQLREVPRIVSKIRGYR